jgi:hypothetical protein
MTPQEPAPTAWPPLWQIHEMLQTLLRGDLVVPKTVVDGEEKHVRALLVATWLAGLATWKAESNYWIFQITDDGRAALSEAACVQRRPDWHQAP